MDRLKRFVMSLVASTRLFGRASSRGLHPPREVVVEFEAVWGLEKEQADNSLTYIYT